MEEHPKHTFAAGAAGIVGPPAPPVRAGFGLLLGVALVLVVAGSLTPFDFRWPGTSAGDLPGPAGLRLVTPTLADAIVNLLLYVPIGVLAGICGPRAFFRRPVATMLFAGLVCAAFSLAIESVQTMLPMRVASWWDVGINTLGGVVGAGGLARYGALAWGGLARVAGRWRAAPLAAVTTAALMAFLVLSLEPARVVGDSLELHRSFAASQWLPIQEPFQADRTLAGADGPERLGAVLAFSVFGFLLALGARLEGRDGRLAIEAALGQGVLLAVVHQVLQLFLVEGGADGALFVLEVLGAGAGAFVAIRVVDEPSGSAWMEDPSKLATPLLLIPLFYFVVGYHLLRYALGKAGDGFGDKVSWVPFAGWFELSLLQAVAALGRSWVMAVILAATVVLLCPQRRFAVRWWLGLQAVIIVSLACELIGFHRGLRDFDVTNPLLAGLGVVAAYAVGQILRQADLPYGARRVR